MNVLISGGGIAGLTLAFWLHCYGHEPLVVERSSKVRDEGYMIDFFGPGYDASEKMGLLPEIERIHYQIPRLDFIAPSGKERFSLRYATLRKNLFGDRHFNFMRGDLEQLLYSKIEDRIEVRLGTSVDGRVRRLHPGRGAWSSTRRRRGHRGGADPVRIEAQAPGPEKAEGGAKVSAVVRTGRSRPPGRKGRCDADDDVLACFACAQV